MKEKDLIKLVMEAGVLAKTPRSGPYHVGITNQETIASHMYRTMLLAYFIGKEEGADVDKILKMGLVKDLPEARTLDLTFIQKKYIKIKGGEEGVIKDQLRGMGTELKDLFEEFNRNKSLEANVANDASILEGLVEAKEYVQQGAKIMERWFLDKKGMLKTKTGKNIFDTLEKETLYWWK
jgi:putative hydrolase of HD superfamily